MSTIFDHLQFSRKTTLGTRGAGPLFAGRTLKLFRLLCVPPPSGAWTLYHRVAIIPKSQVVRRGKNRWEKVVHTAKMFPYEVERSWPGETRGGRRSGAAVSDGHPALPGWLPTTAGPVRGPPMAPPGHLISTSYSTYFHFFPPVSTYFHHI